MKFRFRVAVQSSSPSPLIVGRTSRLGSRWFKLPGPLPRRISGAEPGAEPGWRQPRPISAQSLLVVSQSQPGVHLLSKPARQNLDLLIWCQSWNKCWQWNYNISASLVPVKSSDFSEYWPRSDRTKMLKHSSIWEICANLQAINNQFSYPLAWLIGCIRPTRALCVCRAFLPTTVSVWRGNQRKRQWDLGKNGINGTPNAVFKLPGLQQRWWLRFRC